MTYDVTIEKRVSQSEILIASDPQKALRIALEIWANGEIEFGRDDAELWSAVAITVRSITTAPRRPFRRGTAILRYFEKR